MEDNKDPKFPEYLNKLMEGCSTYTKVSIQVWVATATISIVTLAHQAGHSASALPFNLGSISDSSFYPFSFTIISLLFICFGSALCQAIRTRSLIQRALDALDTDSVYGGKIYLQDVVEAVLHPSLNRVGPLAQVLHGNKQFLPEVTTTAKWSRMLAKIYYVALRIVACTSLYGLPMYALWVSFFWIVKSHMHLWQVPDFIFLTVGTTALIILAQLLTLDILYTIRAVRRINPKTIGQHF